MKGYMYILECSDGSYYTGSTKDIELRLIQHQSGEGSNHTKKRLPVKLLYFEEFMRIDNAFVREKQVQGWSRKKKEALINNMTDELNGLAKCLNETSHVHYGFGYASFGYAQLPGAQPPGAQLPDFGYAQPPDTQLPGFGYAQPPDTQPPGSPRCLSVAEDSEDSEDIRSSQPPVTRCLSGAEDKKEVLTAPKQITI